MLGLSLIVLIDPAATMLSELTDAPDTKDDAVGNAKFPLSRAAKQFGTNKSGKPKSAKINMKSTGKKVYG